jgi:hypothetical protein
LRRAAQLLVERRQLKPAALSQFEVSRIVTGQAEALAQR